MTCNKYTEKSVAQRKEMVKKYKLCFSCLSGNHITKDCKSLFKCVICGGSHHTSLHHGDIPNNQAVHHLDLFDQPIGIIPTALVLVYNHEQGTKYQARAMLDSGAQGSYITESLAKKLELPTYPTKSIFTVATKHKINCKGSTTFALQSINKPCFKLGVHAYVLDTLTSTQPSEEFDISSFTHIREKDDLADPYFNIPGEIDIILGMPEFNDIMSCGGTLKGRKGQPTAYQSKLGWVIMGVRSSPSHAIMAVAKEQHQDKKKAVGLSLEKFWELEELPEPPLSASWTEEEQRCEEHYIKHTIRLQNGRYQVSLPFIAPTSSLGSSFQQARVRWLAVERKLLKQPEIYQQYQAQMEEHLKEDRMELVPDNELFPKGDEKKVYFIPHHVVFKMESSSTKMRIIFDAGAKTTSGESLNDLLPAGPTIQKDLFRQLIHFRENAIAIKGDIRKMYLQIRMAPKDQDYQRILWRKSPEEPIRQYRFKVVIFGVKTSPYLACRTLVQVANDEREAYPTAAEALTRRFYVDDLSTSVAKEENALILYKELRELLASAGFEICKWASNSNTLLEKIPEGDRELSNEISMAETDTIKTLGLKWSPREDIFFFVVQINLQRPHTKREILSEISKIFDPLGLISPVVIKAKLLIQAIWMKSLDWDETVPEDISLQWRAIAETFDKISALKIERPLRMESNGRYELHGFCDASTSAYASCAYLRAITPNGIRCTLIASKTKVAPMQTTTIPRLELQSAVTLVNLMNAVKESLSMEISATYYWSDSSITLWWLKKKPQDWKLFVRNRVAMIQQYTKPEQWAHVISEENPADCASRGILPIELIDHTLWFHGPKWLMNETIIQPPTPGLPKEVEMEASPSSNILAIQRNSPATMLQLLEKIGG